MTATLTIDPAKDTFEGEAILTLNVTAPSRVVWLSLADLDVHDATFLVGGASRAARFVPGPKEIAGFAAQEELPTGAVELRVHYTGHVLPDADRGVFREVEDGRPFLFSQFENTDARRAFPCFDEPSFKVPWQLTLRVPKDAVALSNTPVAAEDVEPTGVKVVRFAETKPLPSYLVAFAVGPFELIDAGKGGKNGVPIRYAVPPGRGSEAAYAVAATPKLMDMLEAAFGIPYPYEKLDVVAIPQLISFGAMENAGLITAGASQILAKPVEETPGFKQNAVALIDHELAHQWFGDLVTMAFWDDVWLNEGFATWMEHGITQQFDPSFGQDTLRAASLGYVMREDSLVSARKVRQEVVSDDDIQNAFDGITYQKGAALLDMFEGYVGQDAFRKGVRSYLERHAHGNATSSDFLADLTAGSGVDIQAAFASFLDRPGVPLITTKLTCDAAGAKLSLSQERFLPMGSKGVAEEPPWQIPICVRYGVGDASAKACVMLSAKTGELPLPRPAGAKSACPTWVVPRAEGRGYYRVSYPLSELQSLLGPQAKHLLPAERLTVYSDAHAAVDTGKIPLGELLRLAVQGVQEADPAVAEAAAELLGTLRPVYLTQEELPRARKFIDTAIGSRLRALGLVPKEGELLAVRSLRETLIYLLVARGSDEKLLAEADAIARRWLDDPKTLPPSAAPKLLRAATRRGDRALFDRLVALAKAEKDSRRREVLIRSLGTFQTPDLTRASVALFIDGTFDVREGMGIIWSQPEDNRADLWAAVLERFDAFMARMPEDLRPYVTYAAEGFCDEADRVKVDTFLRPRASAVTGMPRLLDQTLESISLCATQKASHRASLAKLLGK